MTAQLNPHSKHLRQFIRDHVRIVASFEIFLQREMAETQKPWNRAWSTSSYPYCYHWRNINILSYHQVNSKKNVINSWTLDSYSSIYPAAAKSLQSCPTLCDPIDSSLPGSPVPGILQARTLEWVAIFFSSAWKWKVKVKSLSRVQLLAASWTADYQAPPSMGFSRQEYWSGVPLPSPVYTLADLN